MDPLNLKKLNVERRARRLCALVTDLTDGRDRLVRGGDPLVGDLGEAIKAAFEARQSSLAVIGDRRFLVNVHVPPLRIVAIGAVHIAQALAPMAKASGYELVVIDPRTAFCAPERFPGVQLIAEWPQDAFQNLALDAFTALAAVSHDPKIDDPALIAALEASCTYVGALGSKRSHRARALRLTEAGVTAEQIERIAAPIGLDIGAANSGEIAVAIMAQIVAAFRGRYSHRSVA